MLGVIKQLNGKYSIVDRYNTPSYHTTYHWRHKLKEVGGKWNDEKRKWEDIDEKYLKELIAFKLLKVRIKPYPGIDGESVVGVYEDEIRNNQVQVLDWGDSRVWVDIVEILGE